MPTTRRTLPTWRWMATMLSFLIAGLAGRALGGPVDSPGAALVGGLATGAVLGLAQALAARGALGPVARWAGAMALGYGTGLTAGAAVVDYETTTAALSAMGAVTGAFTGAAGLVALRAAHRPRLGVAWAAATPALLALGWTTTSLAGIDVEAQYTVFGASGALVVTVLSGVLLTRLDGESSPAAESQGAAAAILS